MIVFSISNMHLVRIFNSDLQETVLKQFGLPTVQPYKDRGGMVCQSLGLCRVVGEGIRKLAHSLSVSGN